MNPATAAVSKARAFLRARGWTPDSAQTVRDAATETRTVWAHDGGDRLAYVTIYDDGTASWYTEGCSGLWTCHGDAEL